MPADDQLTDQMLDEILARAERATPGPWRSFIEGRDHTSGDHFIMTGPANSRGGDLYISPFSAANQDFIAHAREDVPNLVAEVRRLRRQLTGRNE